MANEVLDSSLQPDVREADRIAGNVRMLLADTGSVLRIPGLFDYQGSINAFGSDTFRSPYVQHNALAAATEIESPSNTALTDSSATTAVARGALVHQISDLALMTSRGAGDVGLEFLAQKLAGDARRYEMDLVCAVGAAFTSTVGTTTANMTVDDFFAAKAALINASNTGRGAVVLYPQQWNDFVDSLRAEGGAIQYRADASAALESNAGQGYAGSYLGYDFYINDRVDTANGGADSSGFMFHPGAMGYADGDPTSIIRSTGSIVTAAGPGLAIEVSRPQRTASVDVIAHMWLGVSLLEDARGVAIITDR